MIFIVVAVAEVPIFSTIWQGFLQRRQHSSATRDYVHQAAANQNQTSRKQKESFWMWRTVVEAHQQFYRDIMKSLKGKDR
jgi:hypothetical protein